MRRFATWKWQLEMVGEVMTETDTEFYVGHLVTLSTSLKTLGIRMGLQRYYQAMFLEKLSKFRLDYTYDACKDYFENVYDVVLKANELQQLSTKPESNFVYTSNSWKMNTTDVVIAQIEDMKLSFPKGFNLYRVPLNVLTLIDQDLVKLQEPAIASIKNYILWHARYHGNWQDDIDMLGLDLGDITSGGTPGVGLPAVSPKRAALEAAAAEAAAKVAAQTPTYSFRDIAQNDAEFGGFMGGFVESESESHAAAFDSSSLSLEELRRLRAEEELRLREIDLEQYADFRSQKDFPNTIGRVKEFAKQRGEIDFTGVKKVQPLKYEETTKHNEKGVKRRHGFQTMAATNGDDSSSTHESTSTSTCPSLSTEERATLIQDIESASFALLAECTSCVSSLDTHKSIVSEVIAALVDVPVSDLAACSVADRAISLKKRLGSIIAAASYVQVHFLQPYYALIHAIPIDHVVDGGDATPRAVSLSAAQKDLEWIYLWSVQVVANHLPRTGSGDEQWTLGSLEHPSVGATDSHIPDWCTLLLNLVSSHPRTRVPLVQRRPDTPASKTHAWTGLAKHVHEILGWSWFVAPQGGPNKQTTQHETIKDIRHRHVTHVAMPIDGIQQVAIFPTHSDVTRFGHVTPVESNHTASYPTATSYTPGRALMEASSDEEHNYDLTHNDAFHSYNDGGWYDDDYNALLESETANVRSRAQMEYLLRRNNVSLTSFDIESFLVTRTPASFEILSERLIARMSNIYQRFRKDDAKSWHSDRSKSSSASYDFDPQIKTIDFLIWLDSMNYNPTGHLGLDTFALFSEEHVQMISKKVSADDKSTRESQLRSTVPTSIWLKDVSGFERWRWSWSHRTARDLLTEEETIVFSWLESWACTSNLQLGAMVAVISSTMWAILQIVRYLITKPWQRSSLVRNGTIHYEQKYHEEYERRERNIVLYRILPIQILVTYLGNFALATFVLALNFTYYNWLAMFFYLAIFRWLTTIIFDVYCFKFILYLCLFIFPKLRTGDMKPPLCPCSVPLSSSIMMLNPLRPANDEQLRQAVKKQVDLLWAASSQHIISILVLQAEGNSTKTFRRYESIIRTMLYDDPDIPQQVKDRFYVFQCAEVTKPHNFFKVMHWMFMRSEVYDPVTREFLFGVDTSQLVSRTRKVIRRVPYGTRPPNFCTLAGPNDPLKLIDQIDATGVERMDDREQVLDEERQSYRDVAPDSDDDEDAPSAGVAPSDGVDGHKTARRDVPKPKGKTKKFGLLARWRAFAEGGPQSAYDPEEARTDPRAKRAQAKARKLRAGAKVPTKVRVKSEASQNLPSVTSKGGDTEREDSYMPDDSDFVDELYAIHERVEVFDDGTVYHYTYSDDEEDGFVSDYFNAAESDEEGDKPVEKVEEDDTPIKAKFHSTYEPLVYLGGDVQYQGVSDRGADAGILCTVQGLKNLTYFRNESKPGEPFLENFAVLDADNYVEPVTLLRMLATMTDDYMIWQPCIKFYNRDQSAYAYLTDFANEHLGHFMNVANTWMYGGIRSFGKYFGRLKRFYYEECTSASCATTPEQYSFMFNICSGLLTLCCILWCIRPLGEAYLWVLFSITPVITGATCGVIWWTHRQLRQQAFDVSKLSDPNIGKGEELLGFGPVQGDDVFAQADSSAGPARRRGRNARRVGAALGDSRKVHARFQNAFPLNRLFIQSEDARHGGPFGRAVYLMDDCIHEATPISPIDSSHREMSKWLPTFDMRDFLLLHTPLLWILQHLTVSVWIAGCTSLAIFGIFLLSFSVDILGSSLAQVWFFLMAVFCGALFWAFYSIREAMTEPVLMSLRACRFPELPERALYSEDLMIRGIWSETVWLMQFALGIFCLLVPGTVEIAYPFLGEMHFLLLLILLIHPKFTAPLLTRLHFIFHPRWRGYWRSRAAVVEANEKAKDKGIKILMAKGKQHLIDNAGYVAATTSKDEVVTIDDDGDQIVKPANEVGENGTKTITADELYDLSKSNNLTHTCLFETGKFNVCGRNLPKWNKDASLKEGEKYSKLKDADGFVRDTRFLFRLPNLEECGHKLELDDRAFQRRIGKLKDIRKLAEEERTKVENGEEEANKGELVAFPLARADESEESDSDGHMSPPSTPRKGSHADSDAESDADADPMAPPRKSRIGSISPPHKVAFPLGGPVIEIGDVSEEVALHEAHLLDRASTWNERQYIIYREKRWQPVVRLCFFWLLHDLPVGIFEFTASTTVFGLKLLVKPPQVIWSMIGCCIEIKGLLVGVQTPGTWPSFVESTKTLPLSAYIHEYHVPMSVSLILFLLSVPSMPTLLAQSPLLTNNWSLAFIGLFFGSLFGLWPAWTSFKKLQLVVTNKSAGGWKQLRQLRHFRESWSFVLSILLFGCILFFSLGSWMLRGSLPATFFIRSFPILVASFVLGPGIAWLLGMSHGVLDTSCNPPRYRRAYHSMLLCVGVGLFILSVASVFIAELSRVLLPLQRAMGDAAAGTGPAGTSVPTGDGGATVVLPFSLTYGEMLKAPSVDTHTRTHRK